MSPRVVDLDLRRSLRRDAERLAGEHPELTREIERERCAAWLADEPPDDSEEPEPNPVDEPTGDEIDSNDEPDPSETGGLAQRRRERPTSRTRRDP